MSFDISQFVRIIIPEELLVEPRILYQFYVYPILTALITAASIVVIYKKKPFFKKIISKFAGFISRLIEDLEKKKDEERVKVSYFSLRKERFSPSNLIGLGIYMAGGLLILMILTKLIFFGIVPTQSMAPTIMAGDLVLGEGLSKNVSVGDILVFKPPKTEQMYVHRVYSISGETIITKGDNAAVDVWKLTKKNIIGKAVTINGKPIKIGDMGFYFMTVRDPRVASDPSIKSIRQTITTLQTFGPIVAITLLLFAFLFGFKEK